LLTDVVAIVVIVGIEIVVLVIMNEFWNWDCYCCCCNCWLWMGFDFLVFLWINMRVLFGDEEEHREEDGGKHLVFMVRYKLQ